MLYALKLTMFHRGKAAGAEPGSPSGAVGVLAEYRTARNESDQPLPEIAFPRLRFAQ